MFVVLIFGHSTFVCFPVCVMVLESAVNREELVVHTLEDFHVPQSFEFGDRSPFEKYS